MKHKWIWFFIFLLGLFGWTRPLSRAEDEKWIRITKDGGLETRLIVYGQGEPIKLSLDASESERGPTKIRIYKIGEEEILKYLTHDEKYNQIYTFLPTEGLEVEGELTVGTAQAFNLPIETTGWRLVEAVKEGVKDQVVVGIDGMGTIAKEGRDTIILWSQNFSDKKSVKGGQVRVYSLRDRVEIIQETTVDEQGLALVRSDKRADVVVVEHEGRITLTPLNETNLNLEWYYDWKNFVPYKVGTMSFVFTDRPIYKPGDTLYFKAILRSNDDGRYWIPTGNATVKVSRGW